MLLIIIIIIKNSFVMPTCLLYYCSLKYIKKGTFIYLHFKVNNHCYKQCDVEVIF